MTSCRTAPPDSAGASQDDALADRYSSSKTEVIHRRTPRPDVRRRQLNGQNPVRAHARIPGKKKGPETIRALMNGGGGGN